MEVKDLSAGNAIDVIQLVAKNVGQGKFGKPPGNTPYQHLWLTDGTADIRFSLFGDDVNKIQEGQTVRVINGYVKEYPAGSGKLQLALSRDGGAWQVVSGQGTVTRSDDIVAAPVSIVNSDSRDRRIVRQTCLKATAQLWQGLGIDEGGACDTRQFFATAQKMYDWVMAEEDEDTEEPEKPSETESPKVQGPQAAKMKLNVESGLKEDAGWTGPPTPDLVQKFAATMNGVLGGDKERHAWLKWTYGHESSKDVTGAKLQVVLDMLAPTYTDKKWVPTRNVEAIKAMYKQALIDTGQTFEESVEELYGP